VRRIDRVVFPVHDIVVDAVFDVGTSMRDALKSLCVGLVLRKEQRRRPFAVETALPIGVTFRFDNGISISSELDLAYSTYMSK
jgi:hypothetical protein